MTHYNHRTETVMIMMPISERWLQTNNRTYRGDLLWWETEPTMKLSNHLFAQDHHGKRVCADEAHIAFFARDNRDAHRSTDRKSTRRLRRKRDDQSVNRAKSFEADAWWFFDSVISRECTAGSFWGVKVVEWRVKRCKNFNHGTAFALNSHAKQKSCGFGWEVYRELKVLLVVFLLWLATKLRALVLSLLVKGHLLNWPTDWVTDWLALTVDENKYNNKFLKISTYI